MKKSIEDKLSLFGIMLLPLISLICGIWILTDKSMINDMEHPLVARLFFGMFVLVWIGVVIALPFWWYKKPRR